MLDIFRRSRFFPPFGFLGYGGYSVRRSLPLPLPLLSPLLPHLLAHSLPFPLTSFLVASPTGSLPPFRPNLQLQPLLPHQTHPRGGELESIRGRGGWGEGCFAELLRDCTGGGREKEKEREEGLQQGTEMAKEGRGRRMVG